MVAAFESGLTPFSLRELGFFRKTASKSPL